MSWSTETDHSRVKGHRSGSLVRIQTSEVALTSPLCILLACKKVWNHNFFGRVILICRSAHVWRDIAAIILFDASKGLFLTAITFVPIKCLYELFFHTLRSETHQGVDSHTVCFGALC